MPDDAPSPVSVEIAGVPLRNPVLLAAGTAGYVDEMADALDLSRVGGVVSKSITGEPREGHPTWRIIETRRGMLNAIGLANVGMERFRDEYAARIASCPARVFGSVAGSTVEEYAAVSEMWEGIEALAGVELNVSCPNVHSGTQFGDSADLLAEVVRAARAALKTKPLLVKLPPTTSGGAGASIVDLAGAALDAGADGLCVANTISAMAIDVKTRRPRLANVTGGLSGPAAHAVAVRLVHLVHTQVAKERGAPVIGIGGVMDWEDAAEMILAGASAVQMGTALFVDPRAPGRVARGLEQWVSRQGARTIRELVGAMERDG